MTATQTPNLVERHRMVTVPPRQSYPAGFTTTLTRTERVRDGSRPALKDRSTEEYVWWAESESPYGSSPGRKVSSWFVIFHVPSSRTRVYRSCAVFSGVKVLPSMVKRPHPLMSASKTAVSPFT